MGLKRRGCKEALSAKKTWQVKSDAWESAVAEESDGRNRPAKDWKQNARIGGCAAPVQFKFKKVNDNCCWSATLVLFNLPVLISSTMPPVAGQQH